MKFKSVSIPSPSLCSPVLKLASHCGSEITATGVVAGDSGLASSFIAGTHLVHIFASLEILPAACRLGFLTDVKVAEADTQYMGRLTPDTPTGQNLWGGPNFGTT